MDGGKKLGNATNNPHVVAAMIPTSLHQGINNSERMRTQDYTEF